MTAKGAPGGTQYDAAWPEFSFIATTTRKWLGLGLGLRAQIRQAGPGWWVDYMAVEYLEFTFRSYLILRVLRGASNLRVTFDKRT